MRNSRRHPGFMVTADDLTGAVDVGTSFHLAGMRVRIVPHTAPKGRSRNRALTVFDLDGRNDDAATFRRKLRRLQRDVGMNWTHWYHKTDSALRGWIGEQVVVLMKELKATRVPFVPANPAGGRITVDGIHYVNGQPLAESILRNDPEWPRRESRVDAVLGPMRGVNPIPVPLECVHRGAKALRRTVNAAPEKSLLIFDALDGRQMRSIAAAVKDARLVIGSAGLARPLGRLWTMPPSEPWKLPRALCKKIASDSPVLVVSGSASPAARAQCARLSASRLRAVRLIAPPERQADRPQDVRRCLRRRLRAHMHDTRLFVISGGATATDVCDLLGVTELRLLDVLGPGIGLVHACGRQHALMVLKPGSFGRADFLLRAVRRLRDKAEEMRV